MKPMKSSLSLPIKTRIILRISSVVINASCRSDFTVNRRLYNFFDCKIPANPKPRKSVSTFDVSVDPSRNLWFRLFVPSTKAKCVASPVGDLDCSSPLPVILFFHGGAFTFLSAASYPFDAVCRRLSRRLSAIVVSVNYRLAPEHKLPAQYDDVFDALRFLNDHHRSISSWPPNADLRRCFLAGDSAGGNIAHHTAVRLSEGPLSEIRVIGSLIIQPFFGGEETLESEFRLEGAPIVSLKRTKWLWKALLPDGVGPDHWAINVCGPNAKDISGIGLPATMVVVGGFDPLQDWQMRYFSWMKENGKEVMLVEYPDAFHGFYTFPEVADSSLLIDEIKDFMAKQLDKHNKKFGMVNTVEY